jgi:hypothetical protein
VTWFWCHGQGGKVCLQVPQQCASSSITGYVLTTQPDDVLHAHGAVLAAVGEAAAASSTAAAPLPSDTALAVLASGRGGKAARAYKSTRVAKAAVRAALARASHKQQASGSHASSALLASMVQGASVSCFG